MTTPSSTPAPTSPCVGVCALNPDDICIGCGRSLEEIAQWSRADAAQQTKIATAAARRLAGMQAPIKPRTQAKDERPPK